MRRRDSRQDRQEAKIARTTVKKTGYPHIFIKSPGDLGPLAILARRSCDKCLSQALFSQPLPEKSFFHLPSSLRLSARSAA
jgi:hypothetical protein